MPGRYTPPCTMVRLHSEAAPYSCPPNEHVRPRARITAHPLWSTSAYWRYFFFPQQALITGGFVFVFTCSRGARSPAGAPSPPSAGRRHRHRRSPSSIATLTPPWWPRLCALPSAPQGEAPGPGEHPTASITRVKSRDSYRNYRG